MSLFNSTEGPDLSTLDNSATSFSLSTGAVRGLWDVVFDRQTKRFLYGSIDVTPNLAPFQKRAFPSYDPTDDLNAAADADLLAREGRTVALGPTDWFGAGVADTASDIKNVGAGALDTVKKAVAAAPETLKGLSGVLFGLAALAGLYLLWKNFSKK